MGTRDLTKVLLLYSLILAYFYLVSTGNIKFIKILYLILISRPYFVYHTYTPSNGYRAPMLSTNPLMETSPKGVVFPPFTQWNLNQQLVYTFMTRLHQ